MEKKHSWLEIEQEYVTSNCSQRDLCAKYGFSPSHIGTYASKNNWTKKREQYKKRVVAKAAHRIEKKEVNRLAKIFNITDNLTVVINNVTKNAADKNLKGMANAKDINELVKATKELVSITRNLYDIPTLQEREAREIALERLRLEKEKLTKDNIDLTDTGIIMLSEVIEEKEHE